MGIETQNNRFISGSYDAMLQMPLSSILFCIDEIQYGVSSCNQAKNEFNNLFLSLHTEQIGRMPFMRQVALLKKNIFGEYGIFYGANPRCEVITLAGTLLNKKGACLGLTALYYALAENVPIEIQPLLYDGHITICKARTPCQRIEVSCRGAFVFKEGKGDCVDTVQPIVLTKQQFIAVYLSNQAGFAFAKLGKLTEAMEALNLAVDLFPAYRGAWINRAIILSHVGNENNLRRSRERVCTMTPCEYLKRLLKIYQQ